MKVAVLLPSLSRSATITVALNIAAGLIAVGHEVDIFHFDNIVERPAPPGCAVYKISFFQRVDFSEYDIVHSHNLRPDLYVAINRKRINCACVSTVHNYVEKELENYYGKFAAFIFTRLWMWAWRHQDSLVCLTNDAAKYYRQLLPCLNVEFVYNGVALVNLSDFDFDSRIVHAVDSLKKDGLFVLGTYCNQTKGKGLDQIVRLLHVGKSLGAIIIGSGPEAAALASLAKELGVESRCLFFSFTPFAYVYNKYFDAYIIPSRSEGFGMSLVEAALSDAEIMCSDIPVFREMFDSSEVSFFGLDDTGSMLKIVDQIKNGVSKRGLARRKSQSLFSIDIMANNYFKIYSQALKRLQS